MSPDRDTRPRRADAVRNRARVLQAARALFASRGVDVPLDEIASHAGVGPGTLHRHFPSKQTLLAAVVVDRLEERAAEGSALADSGDPEGLFKLLERLLDDGLESRAVKAALTESGFELRRVSPATAERLEAALTHLVLVAQRAGAALPQLDSEDVKAALVGALAAQDHVADQPERIARVRRIVVTGLRPDRGQSARPA